jgi:hypothetical protein
VEAHDIYIALEGINECAELRGRVRAGLQQPTHGFGADGIVSLVPCSFPQGGAERGEHAANLAGEVAQGRDHPEADVPVGVLQQGKEAWHRRQRWRGSAPSCTGLQWLKGAVMAEGH